MMMRRRRKRVRTDIEAGDGRMYTRITVMLVMVMRRTCDSKVLLVMSEVFNAASRKVWFHLML